MDVFKLQTGFQVEDNKFPPDFCLRPAIPAFKAFKNSVDNT